MKKRTLLALVAVLLTFSIVPVMAADSPTASAVYNVTVDGSTVGTDGSSGIQVDGGSISISTGTVTVGEEVTLTATADDGYSFSKWIISGDYTIVSGSLTSKTITIIPNGDVDINGEFVADTEDTTTSEEDAEIKGDDDDTEESTTKTTSSESTDSSTTSPKTGANDAVAVLALLLIGSGCTLVINKKKLSR